MKFRFYSILLALFILAACHKEPEINKDISGFDVKSAATTYKVGEDVVFNLTGKANVISFFSGELYHEYAHKDGRVLPLTVPTIAFTSAVSGGTQANQLTMLASTDFNGVYNDTLKAPLTDIHAASWTDISSRFTLGNSASFLASGTKSIADLVVPHKPLYIAFKYTTKPQGLNGVARAWMIQSFTLTGTTSVGNLTLADMSNAGFRIIDGSPATAPTLSTVTATRVTMLGNAYTPANDPSTESWAISRAFTADTIDAGPDYPLGIKGMANPTLSNYTYKYSKAGVYKVYFVATNANAYKSESVVKEIDITITP